MTAPVSEPGGPVRLCAEEGHVVAGHFRGRTCPRPQPRQEGPGQVRFLARRGGQATRSGPPQPDDRRGHAGGDADPDLADDPQQLDEQASTRRDERGTDRRRGRPRARFAGVRSSSGGSDGHLAAGGVRAAGANRTVVPRLRGWCWQARCPGECSRACSSGCADVYRLRCRSAPVDGAGAPAGGEARGRRSGGADQGSCCPAAHPAPSGRSGRRASTTAQIGHQVTTDLSRAETTAVANQEIVDRRTLDVEHFGPREEVHQKAHPRLDPPRGRRGHPPRLRLGGLAHLPGIRPSAGRLAERHRTAGRAQGHHDVGPHSDRRNRRRPAGRGVLGQVGGR